MPRLPHPLSPLVTTGEAAALLGVSRERVHQFLKNGRLKVDARDSYGRRLLRRSAVERLRAERDRAKARDRERRGET